jgi:hypothetical protein
MGMGTRFGRFVLALGLAGVLLLVSVVWAQGATDQTLSPPSDCRIASSEFTPPPYEQAARDEAFSSQAWMANDEAQQGIARLDEALNARFGTSDDGGDDRLRSGLIGFAADQANRQLVAVVDPSLVDREQLQKELTATTDAVAVRVQAGCHSSAELLAAKAEIESGSWNDSAQISKPSYGYYLDGLTSTWRVSFREGDASAASALEAETGDTVTVEFGDASRATRLKDGEPHWGGSGIRHPRGRDDGKDFQCTSGFTAVLPSGSKGSVSAGHCFVGDSQKNLWSGNQFYGVVGARAKPFPKFDMRRIKPSGESFARKIHTDPPAGDFRTVVAASNPSGGSFVCLSGAKTEALCGVEIINLNGTYCDSSGCTPSLAVGRKGGTTVVRGGDSGGPVYNRFSNDNAAIRGMIIAFTNGGAKGYFHKVNTIKNELGISGIG